MRKQGSFVLIIFCILLGWNLKIHQQAIIVTAKKVSHATTPQVKTLANKCKSGLVFLRNLPIETALKFALIHEDIVVSLTTTPHRINKIQPVLQTLFKQNVKVKKIYLNIPYKFKRDNLEYVIPEWLQNESRITILRTDDYGPATKLLGLLEQVQLPAKTIIITVDDDVYYPQNLILHLAYQAKKFPNSVIAVSGADIDYDANGKIRSPGHGTIDVTDPGALVDVVSGFGGIAYRAGFFDATIFQIQEAPNACYIHDDFYISFYLARHNIPRRIVNNKLLSMANIRWNAEVGFQKDALFKITPLRAEICKTCLEYMRAQYANVDF